MPADVISEILSSKYFPCIVQIMDCSTASAQLYSSKGQNNIVYSLVRIQNCSHFCRTSYRWSPSVFLALDTTGSICSEQVDICTIYQYQVLSGWANKEWGQAGSKAGPFPAN